jgi:hypothetical protein
VCMEVLVAVCAGVGGVGRRVTRLL